MDLSEEKQRLVLLRLVHELKKIAMLAGSHHSFWDDILEMNEHLNNRKTILNLSTEQLITRAQELLKKVE